MFDESKLADVVAVLERREASLWHACQLLELAAYLRSSGIRSELVVERAGVSSGPGRGGASDRILMHLDDIGHGFAAGWATHPDPLGPITLQLAPALLTDARDAAFTLRSALSTSLEVGPHSLSDPRTVDELFWYDPGIGFPRSTWMRFGDHLRGNFGAREASTLDVLVTPRRGAVDLKHVVAVWVEPVELDGIQLIDLVSGLCDELGVALRIRRRTLVDPGRRKVWHDIAALLCDGPLPLLQLVNRADASPAFRAWARGMMRAGRADAWERFAHRLYERTLRPMAVATADQPQHGGFWSRARRQSAAAEQPSKNAVVALPLTEAARAEAARACGHATQPWDAGVCYACLRRARSGWRYDS